MAFQAETMAGTVADRRIFTLKNTRTMPGIVAWLVATLARAIGWTLRRDLDDRAGLLPGGTPWPVIVVLWHNRILFGAGCFPLALRRRAAVLISASRDGEYASRVVQHFGLRVVRGSSSRRGFRALRELTQCLEEGTSVVLAVDGPRGPRYQPHAGAVALAAACNVPIVPISINAVKRWELRSWDRTQIPKPFSRIRVVVGEPLRVTVADEAAQEALRAALMAVTDDSGEPSATRGGAAVEACGTTAGDGSAADREAPGG